jgi:hypothetical protein
MEVKDQNYRVIHLMMQQFVIYRDCYNLATTTQ